MHTQLVLSVLFLGCAISDMLSPTDDVLPGNKRIRAEGIFRLLCKQESNQLEPFPVQEAILAVNFS
jgi:hypothetical protein